MLAQFDHTTKAEKKKSNVSVEIRGLRKAFGTNLVLDDFNLHLNRGVNIAVLGRSGSGKSVLIKCIIGLLNPDAGSINVLGRDVLNMKEEDLDQLRVKVGFLFQNNALYDSMSVKENLEFPLRRHWMNMKQEEINSMIVHALEDVGLAHTIDMMPLELSGGMRKRIALARTLILRPEIILYDEPTTGLDPITGKEISNLIMAIKKKYNTSAIIISHDLHCIRMTADRIVVLIDGKCYAEGTYEELEESRDKNLKAFFD